MFPLKPFHQKVLFGYCVAVLLACVLVPWRSPHGILLGYWFIWGGLWWTKRIDYARIGLAIFLFTVIAAIIVLWYELWGKQDVTRKPR